MSIPSALLTSTSTSTSLFQQSPFYVHFKQNLFENELCLRYAFYDIKQWENLPRGLQDMLSEEQKHLLQQAPADRKTNLGLMVIERVESFEHIPEAKEYMPVCDETCICVQEQDDKLEQEGCRIHEQRHPTLGKIYVSFEGCRLFEWSLVSPSLCLLTYEACEKKVNLYCNVYPTLQRWVFDYECNSYESMTRFFFPNTVTSHFGLFSGMLATHLSVDFHLSSQTQKMVISLLYKPWFINRYFYLSKTKHLYLSGQMKTAAEEDEEERDAEFAVVV